MHTEKKKSVQDQRSTKARIDRHKTNDMGRKSALYSEDREVYMQRQ